MIVIATQCFPPVLGGMESLMGGLANAIAGSGRSVVVLADGKWGNGQALYDGACYYPIYRFRGPRPWRKWRKAKATARLLRGGGVEAIITDSWKSAETVLPQLEGQRVPVIVLAHGNDVLIQGDVARVGRVQKVLSQASFVVANSSFTAELVRNLGVERRSIRVIYPGFTPPLSPKRQALRAAAQLVRPFDHTMLTVARLESRKGHDQVIRCMPELLRRFPRLGYVVAGDGPDRERLEMLSVELGVRESVRFVGRVSEDIKAALLSYADLFVMPVREDAKARSVEGFGISFLEAAFFGVPVIAGDSGGVADAVVQGETGILCDGTDKEAVYNAIHSLLDDPYRREIMGEAAKVRSREFFWPVVVESYLQLLSDTG